MIDAEVINIYQEDFSFVYDKLKRHPLIYREELNRDFDYLFNSLHCTIKDEITLLIEEINLSLRDQSFVVLKDDIDHLV